MQAFLQTAVCLLIGLISVEGPNYPPYAYKGGTVVAVLEYGGGAVENISILYGEEPFAGASLSALKQWRFGIEERGRVQVVLQFRNPELDFPTSNTQTIPFRKPPIGMPYPDRIVQPNYPLFAEGGGSVILDTEVSESGSVSDVEVIQDLGILTDTALEALKKWKFTPARNIRGETISSRIYVVMVYRVPVIAPEEPSR